MREIRVAPKRRRRMSGKVEKPAEIPIAHRVDSHFKGAYLNAVNRPFFLLAVIGTHQKVS
jgi:hypothetical protein